MPWSPRGSLKGPKGDPGAKGDTGATGAPGTTTWAGLTDKAAALVEIVDWIRARANSWTAVQTFKNIVFGGVANMGNVTGNITVNFTNSGQKVRATLVGNVAASVQLPGVGEYTLIVIQDGTGGRTLYNNSNRYWIGDGTAPAGNFIPLNTSANGRTFVKFFYDGEYLYTASAKCSP